VSENENRNGTLLEARAVVKTYGHVEALRGVDFEVRRDEIVALVGDNGAGKSTLIKILSGTVRPDGGEIRLDGEPVTIESPVVARRLGLETVYQDLALAPELGPDANLFLGRELLLPFPLGRLGFLDKRAMRRSAGEAFEKLGVRLPSVTSPVANLSGGQQQGVAVGRAVNWASKVLFLDEPTAALGVVQAQNVLDLTRSVRDAGVSVVFISHNLPQVLEVADRVEVLRLGRRVARFDAGQVEVDDVIAAMTGSAVRHHDEGESP
jgi:simple sugar transport system ATP-binding protein